MVKLLALILLALLSFSVLYNLGDDHTAFACTCIEIKSADEALAESQAVFSGRVDDIIVNEKQHSRIATFTIDRAWKGIPENNTMVLVKTGIDGGLCGYPFEEGRSYVVYSYGKDESGQYDASSCSRTKPLGEADADLAFLGAGYVPVQQPRPEVLEECTRLGIDEEHCSEQTILSRMRTGGMPPSDQIEVLQNPTMLAMFGLLAAGIGGGAAVFYIKTRKGKRETSQ